ncbi:multidrug efflux SMR transporter [Paenibacillus vulneris]|uniref:DMT family transporter n=1 Tax=Paenibacillus vulneris TaxID=1133364 RepID=A0ABW3ULI9_9BACL|nr:multidrug efflux SMR transporter [Paenibacillus sp. 32352]
MDWIALILAGCCEIIGVSGINRIHKSKSIASYSILIGGFLLSFLFLSFSMKTISMGTAYAVWTGIGTAGSALLGMFVYGESREWKRMLFIAMVLTAAVGLKIIS